MASLGSTWWLGATTRGRRPSSRRSKASSRTGRPSTLYRSSVDRGEYKFTRDSADQELLGIDVRRWFHGHRLEAGLSFSIRGRGTTDLDLKRSIVLADQTEQFKRPIGSSALLANHLWLTLESQRTGRRDALPLGVDGFLGASSAEEIAALSSKLSPPVVFVSTRRQSAADLQPMWERVELTTEENEVIRSLRIVEPRLQELRFQKLGCHALLQGENEKVPLGSLGEGVNRMLALALALTTARGGYLFVDEVESGLHYSTHLSMWRLVVETARRLDVQVFCTTHSKDCLEAIGQLHAEAPELAAELSVHRLEQGVEQSTRMSAETVASTNEGGVEVR